MLEVQVSNLDVTAPQGLQELGKNHKSNQPQAILICNEPDEPFNKNSKAEHYRDGKLH